jgi:hypothetical protein
VTLIVLRLSDRGGIANAVVAQKIIELVKGGERDLGRLCEAVSEHWSRVIPPNYQRGNYQRGMGNQTLH